MNKPATSSSMESIFLGIGTIIVISFIILPLISGTSKFFPVPH